MVRKTKNYNQSYSIIIIICKYIKKINFYVNTYWTVALPLILPSTNTPESFGMDGADVVTKLVVPVWIIIIHKANEYNVINLMLQPVGQDYDTKQWVMTSLKIHNQWVIWGWFRIDVVMSCHKQKCHTNEWQTQEYKFILILQS